SLKCQSGQTTRIIQLEPLEFAMFLIANLRIAAPSRHGIHAVNGVPGVWIGDRRKLVIFDENNTDFLSKLAVQRLFKVFAFFDMASRKAPSARISLPSSATLGQQHLVSSQ